MNKIKMYNPLDSTALDGKRDYLNRLTESDLLGQGG